VQRISQDVTVRLKEGNSQAWAALLTGAFIGGALLLMKPNLTPKINLQPKIEIRTTPGVTVTIRPDLI
jgi:hypothetical protein